MIKVGFTFKIDPDLLKRMEIQIDGIRYRSKGHLAEVAILNLLDRIDSEKQWKTYGPFKGTKRKKKR